MNEPKKKVNAQTITNGTIEYKEQSKPQNYEFNYILAKWIKNNKMVTYPNKSNHSNNTRPKQICGLINSNRCKQHVTWNKLKLIFKYVGLEITQTKSKGRNRTEKQNKHINEIIRSTPNLKLQPQGSFIKMVSHSHPKSILAIFVVCWVVYYPLSACYRTFH